MKVAGTFSEIERSDDIEEVDFSIENSPLAFEILSAGIYTDRVLAVIRELSCNAYDAHIDGENPEPFEIHLPNNLEPYFAIRDKGTGLAPAMVKRLYTRYFKSTKTHSDDFVGFMGLGSKSPFAYIESFNVTSYWNNKKYMFSAFKNEVKKPSIAPLGDEDTTEANGIEVRFPVRSYDFYEFQQKTKKALKFFKTKPKIVGVHDFNIPEHEYLIEGDGYSISKSRDTTYVVMGNVGYQFNYEDFQNTEQQLNNRERKLVDWGVHLFVKIGTVTPAASREKITWTPESREAIKNIIKNALNDIEKQAQDALKNVQNIWDARTTLAELRKGILAEVTEIEDAIEWNGKTVRESIRFSDYTEIKKPMLSECLSLDPPGFSRRYGQSKNIAAKNVGNLTRWNIDGFYSDIKVIFVNDLNRGGYSAAKRYMEEKDIRKAVMFSSDVTKELIDEIGCEHLMVYVSKLPKPPRAPRGSGGSQVRNNRTMVQLWDSSGTWKDVEVDVTEGGVYLEVRRDKVKYQPFGSTNYTFEDTHEINKLIEAGKKLGFDEELYVIRPCDLSKITKNEGWITYYQWIEDTLKQRSDLVVAANSKLTFNPIHSELISYFENHVDRIASESSYLKELVLEFLELKNASSSEEINSFILLNTSYPTYKLERNEAKISKIRSTTKVYPLLDFVGSSMSYSKDAMDAAIEYINLLDENKNKQQLKDAA